MSRVRSAAGDAESPEAVRNPVALVWRGLNCYYLVPDCYKKVFTFHGKSTMIKQKTMTRTVAWRRVTERTARFEALWNGAGSGSAGSLANTISEWL